MSDLQSNIQVGAVRGVTIGAFFSVGALIMVLVRGTGVLEDYRISLLGLIAYNLVEGAVTGAIVGSLLPFAMRDSLGAAGVGFVAMLPASIVGMLLVTPPTEWHETVPIGSLVGAALLGGLGGPLIRSQDAGETTPNWRFIGIVVAVAGILVLSTRLAGWW